MNVIAIMVFILDQFKQDHANSNVPVASSGPTDTPDYFNWLLINQIGCAF